jgi:hypothetical protein
MKTSRIRKLFLSTIGLLLVSSVIGTLAVAKPRPHHVKHHVTHHSAIPQHNGSDRDSDNNGGPSDGDGNL